MKILTIFIIGLVMVSFVVMAYGNYNNKENIKTFYDKHFLSKCELKPLEDRWVQIENCAIYRRIKK